MAPDEDREAARRLAPHRWLPVAGGIVAGGAVVAHLAGGAALMHLGLGAALTSLGADVENLGAGALMAGAAALIALKVLLVIAARRRWLRR